MDAARSVTATFDLEPTPTYLLTVTQTGDGSGTVSSSPTGIDCGTDCSETYAPARVVTLTAVAGTGSDVHRLERRRLHRHRHLPGHHGRGAQRHRHLRPGADADLPADA